MHQKQLPKISELPDCDICTASSLETFHTTNTYTYVCSLNHGYVVGAVSNGQKNCFQMTLDKLHHQRFLEGRNSTANYCLAHHSQIQEILF
jgi:hypothetical protein